MQPVCLDDGVPVLDVVASLGKFIPIKFETKTAKPENYMDCSIAKLVNSTIVTADIALIVKLRSIDTSSMLESV